MLLTQQIERDVPHRYHIFGSILLPDTAAVFIERDVQRPMELMLDIPMLADHGDEGGGRPYQTGKGEAVVTGDRHVRVRHAHRFHDTDRLETRPWRELRQSSQVCDGPDPAAHH